MAKKVLLLVGDYAEDYEVMVPLQILKFISFEADSASPGKKAGDTIRTAVHDFLGDATYRETEGHRFLIDRDFQNINAKEYDGLYITGGRAPEYLRLNEKVLDLTRQFFLLNKPVAAICHGIQILTAADVVKGRKLTCYPAVAPEVSMAGGIYVEVPSDGAVTDGNLATSPAWPGIWALMQQFVVLLR